MRDLAPGSEGSRALNGPVPAWNSLLGVVSEQVPRHLMCPELEFGAPAEDGDGCPGASPEGHRRKGGLVTGLGLGGGVSIAPATWGT